MSEASWNGYAQLRSSMLKPVGLRSVFDGAVSGKTVLHVGCRDGSLCMEAAYAGAARVVGFDVDPVYIHRARERAEGTGLPVEFLCGIDFTSLAPEGEFDVVLCPEDLDSHENPVSLVNALSRLTGDVLVVGVRFGSAGVLKQRLETRAPTLLTRWLAKLPVMLIVSKQPMLRGQLSMSPAAVRTMLLSLTHRFVEADIIEADEPLQTLVRARRRRGRNLVVVAGPDAAGKSSAAARVIEGHAHELCEELTLDDVPHWHSVNTHNLQLLATRRMENAVLEYNLLTPLKGALRLNARDPSLQFLTNFENVYVLTLWVEPDVLRKRLRKRVDSPVIGKRLGGARRVLEFYQDDERVADVYRRWVEYCNTLDLRGHWVVHSGDGYQGWGDAEKFDQLTTDTWIASERRMNSPP